MNGSSGYERRVHPMAASASRVATLAVMTMAFLALTGCTSGEEVYDKLRESMVREQISRRGISDEKVLSSMREVPRHMFVPEEHIAMAYIDSPLPIGKDQTISQPYIVALMTESLELEEGARVLEIGTGSGYQAAVLSLIADTVYSIEIIPELAEAAAALLDTLGYGNVEVMTGDGYYGYPSKAPFDGIIVTAAAPEIPGPLVDQLKTGGRLVIPVGRFPQRLHVFVKRDTGLEEVSSTPVRFVPMKGKAGEEKGK